MSLPAAPGSKMLHKAARGVGEMGDACLDPSEMVWDRFSKRSHCGGVVRARNCE